MGGINVASHIPILVRIMDHSDGDVLELGTGYYSTSILSWMCELQNRNLISYEDNLKWYKHTSRKQSELHKVLFAENWDNIDIVKQWGVVFIDHQRKFRSKHMALLANYAQYIICHDTNSKDDKRYGYSASYSLFKYRYDYTKLSPYTTIVSNFNSLDWI